MRVDYLHRYENVSWSLPQFLTVFSPAILPVYTYSSASVQLTPILHHYIKFRSVTHMFISLKSLTENTVCTQ